MISKINTIFRILAVILLILPMLSSCGIYRPVSAKNLAILVNLIKNGTISGKIAKTVFELMLDGDKDPQRIVEEKGLKQQSDPKAIETLNDSLLPQ